MKSYEFVSESWSEKYKRSIDCSHPKGFSQQAHCQGRKKKVKESDKEELIYIIYVNNQPVVRHTSKKDAERDVVAVLKKHPKTKIEIRTQSKNSVGEDVNGLSPSTKLFLEKEQSTRR